MQPESDLLQRGITAFQAGDRDNARKLLSEFVLSAPDNEQGWYFLAAVENDPAMRKAHLERVLVLNPSNAKAREVLERIKAREVEVNPVASASPAAASAPKSTRPKIYTLDPNDAAREGAASAGEGIRLPFRIPGAPQTIAPAEVVSAGWTLLKEGWQALLRRPGTYEFQVDSATWWRFWLVVVSGALISSALSLLLALLFVLQSDATLFSFVSILLTPLLTIPITVGALFAGIYAAHHYARSKGWNAPLVRHAMAAGIVWAPTVVFSSVLTFILSLLGLGGGLSGVFMLVLAGYIMGEGYGRLYVISEPRDKYAVPAITLLTMLVVIVIISVLLSGLIIGRALPFAIG
ncbi:MAG: hypothetical protein SGJ24_09275 [Chloroflexota bacterium]|nr:hypothetical protein [Chloroflexota bacterium]